MTRSRDFPCENRSVTLARQFVVDSLAGESEETKDRAELLVSELATNAVLHAGTKFTVAVTTAPGQVCVEVSDHGDGLPERRTPSALTLGGRGLQIVEALSEHWEVRRRSPTGKTVSVVVARGSAGRLVGGGGREGGI